MKITEFRKLIREEVRKVLKEGVMDKRIAALKVSPKLLKVTDKDPELTMKEIRAKYQLKLLKTWKSDFAVKPVKISQIIGADYIVVEVPEGGNGINVTGEIFKADDLGKVLAAIKDDSYFGYNDWTEIPLDEEIK